MELIFFEGSWPQDQAGAIAAIRQSERVQPKRTPRWLPSSTSSSKQLLLLGGVSAEGDIPPKSVILRVRYRDRSRTVVAEKIPGLSWSERAGSYCDPLKIATDGLFKVKLQVPSGAASLEVCVQRSRRKDADSIRVASALLLIDAAGHVEPAFGLKERRQPKFLDRLRGDPSESPVDVARNMEHDLDNWAYEYATEFLERWTDRLFRNDAPYSEALIREVINQQQDRRISHELGRRYLKAGRSSEAAALFQTAPQDRMLGREKGRIELLDYANGLPSAGERDRDLRGKGVVYLLHNSLPFDSGGYAARAHGLLRGFTAAGLSVYPVGRLGYPSDRGKSSGSDSAKVDNIKYYFLPDDTYTIGQTDQINYIREFADRVLNLLSGPDIRRNITYVQAASFYQNGLAGRLVADRLGVPLVYEIRGMDWFTRGSREPRWLDSEQGHLLRNLELATARCADHVMAITHALREWLVGNGIARSKISVLANGCSIDQFAPQPKDGPLAASLGLSGAFVVGYIGSVVFYEGVELMAEAVALARARSNIDIRFLLVGDGAAYHSVMGQIARSGYDFVVATGRVPHADVPRYYSIIDALALARRPLPVCEVISPLKPFEAMAMGKLIITSDVAAIKEIVDASGGGLLFRANDVDAFADQIIRAAASPDLREELSAKARKWVGENRDWSVLAARAFGDVSSRFGSPLVEDPAGPAADMAAKVA